MAENKQDINNIRSRGMRFRGITFRCSDQTFEDILQKIESMLGCHVIDSRSSNLRLVIGEKGFYELGGQVDVRDF